MSTNQEFKFLFTAARMLGLQCKFYFTARLQKDGGQQVYFNLFCLFIVLETSQQLAISSQTGEITVVYWFFSPLIKSIISHVWLFMKFHICRLSWIFLDNTWNKFHISAHPCIILYLITVLSQQSSNSIRAYTLFYLSVDICQPMVEEYNTSLFTSCRRTLLSWELKNIVFAQIVRSVQRFW